MFIVNIVVHASFDKSQGVNNHFGLTSSGLNLIWQKVDLTKIIPLISDWTVHQKIHKISKYQFFKFSDFFDVQSDLRVG